MSKDNTPTLLRLYHRLLEVERWPDNLERADGLFRGTHRVSGRPDLGAKLDLILEPHRERCAGKGSPRACEVAAREAGAAL